MIFDDSTLGLQKDSVILLPHRKSWEDEAKKIIYLLKSVLGEICIDAQHVGSTSIVGICAKPIIDIAVAVNDLNDVYQYIDILSESGIVYRKIEETGQLLFIMGNMSENIKTHHIHVVRADSQNWINYLNFRDYLNTFSDKAKEYEELKLKLAIQYPDNRKAYTAGKAEIISKLLSESHSWRKVQNICTARVK